MSQPPNAAYRLTGLKLPNDWVVGPRLSTGSESGGSGGFFSVSYSVTNGEKKAFLKAFDLVKALGMGQQQGKTLITILEEQARAFRFETALHDVCVGRKMRRVVKILDHGTADVPVIQGEQISQIPYMIMELAEKGDVRSYIGKSKAIDISLKLMYLKDVASGILQLHKANVAHQDLKPSNVMVFEKNMAKVGDLGRASSQNIPAMHDSLGIAGDRTYAPPEQLYNHVLTDWIDRRMRCDLYQFASIISFVFFGTTINLQLKEKMPQEMQPTMWGGNSTSYIDSLPFLLNTFDEILISWESLCPDWLGADLIDIIKQCGTPDYTRRGSRSTLKQSIPSLGIERFVSSLERLSIKASLESRKPESSYTK